MRNLSGTRSDGPIIGPYPQIDKESVRKALVKMKKGKASWTFGVVSEMLLDSGYVGIERMTHLFNKIISENKVQENWDTRKLGKLSL